MKITAKSLVSVAALAAGVCGSAQASDQASAAPETRVMRRPATAEELRAASAAGVLVRAKAAAEMDAVRARAAGHGGAVIRQRSGDPVAAYAVEPPREDGVKVRAKAAAKERRHEKKDGESNITVVNDEGSFALSIKDGEVVGAKANGQEIPKDRIERDGDHVRLLDKDGDTMIEFRVLKEGGIAYGDGVDTDAFGKAMAGLAVAGLDAKPRPMIGVTMDTIDDDIADQLNLDKDEVVYITSVTEGMPADKAGLKKGDIIFKIDGRSPATQELLREVVQSKGDGDKLRVEVQRKGKKQDIEIEVKVVKAPEAMGFGQGFGQSFGGADAAPGQNTFRWKMDPEQQERMKEMERNFAESAKRYGEMGREAGARAADRARALADELRVQAQDSRKVLEEVHEALAKEYDKLKLTDEDKQKLHEALERVTRAIHEMDFNVEAPRLRLFKHDGDGGAFVTPPPAPMAPDGTVVPRTPRVHVGRDSGASDDRMDRLEERMNRIQELLEKMAEEKSEKKR